MMVFTPEELQELEIPPYKGLVQFTITNEDGEKQEMFGVFSYEEYRNGFARLPYDYCLGVSLGLTDEVSKFFTLFCEGTIISNPICENIFQVPVNQ